MIPTVVLQLRIVVHGVLIAWMGSLARTAAAQQPVAHSPINVRLVTGQPPPANEMAWPTILGGGAGWGSLKCVMRLVCGGVVVASVL